MFNIVSDNSVFKIEMFFISIMHFLALLIKSVSTFLILLLFFAVACSFSLVFSRCLL